MARPRGTLTDDQRQGLEEVTRQRDESDQAYRAYVVQLLTDGCSFAEVHAATGLSTNTLQRWKREA